MTGKYAVLSVIIVSVLLNALAQIFIRVGVRSGISISREALVQDIMGVALRPALLLGIACYGVSVLSWIYVLSRAEVSLAYPFLGLGFVFVAVIGHFLLGETMSSPRALASLLIVTGIVILSQS